MSIKFQSPEVPELKPRIVVFGVGGAGGNAVNNMVASGLEGVEFVAANTDAQALAHSLAPRKIQLGANVTLGLGAGSKPEIGAGAAESSRDEIEDALAGSHMAFITAGMGGGTGTGAAPVIARMAREMGILTVGVVTRPFQFEGSKRQKQADDGIAKLQDMVDTLIVIPNQNLFRVANEKTTFAQAFAMADEVLHSGVRGITDLMVIPGMMNLDFADVRTVMMEMGKAMMGTGEAEGPKRALDAAEAAIANPLLDDVSMKGAKGVLIHITGGPDLTLFEVDEAANRIRAEVDTEANIKVGSTFDERLSGRIRVSVVATGIDAVAKAEPKPVITPASAIRSQTAPAAKPAAPVQPSIPEIERAPIAAMAAANPVHAMQQAAETKLAQPAPASAELSEIEAIHRRIMEASKALTEARAAAAPQPAPQPTRVVRFDDAEIARENARAAIPARPAPEPERPAGMFGGLFTRRTAKKIEEPTAPKFAEPAPQAELRAQARVAKPASPSLFGQGTAEDPLEIPAFLRRNAS
jgi:cell division protein FtsZ